MASSVCAQEMKLGDIVEFSTISPYMNATVIKIDDEKVHLFRPYTAHHDFSYGCGKNGEQIIPLIGYEEISLWKNSKNTYKLLYRLKEGAIK